jgi:hypothetical protein
VLLVGAHLNYSKGEFGNDFKVGIIVWKDENMKTDEIKYNIIKI